MKLDQQKVKAIVSATIYITVGILMCVFPYDMVKVLFTIIGALLLAGGIYSLVKKDFVLGIITTVMGTITILGAWLFLEVMFIIIGIFVILKAALDMYSGIKGKSWLGIVFSVITLTIGVLLIVMGCGEPMPWFFIVMGAIAIAIGVLQLVFTLIDASKEKPAEEKAE